MRALWIVMRKELIDAFRDRRMVLMAFLVMPLAVPSLLAGMSAVGMRKQMQKLEATLELNGYVNPPRHGRPPSDGPGSRPGPCQLPPPALPEDARRCAPYRSAAADPHPVFAHRCGVSPVAMLWCWLWCWPPDPGDHDAVPPDPHPLVRLPPGKWRQESSGGRSRDTA